MLRSLFFSRLSHTLMLLCLLAAFLSMHAGNHVWIKGLRNWAFDTYNYYYPRESNNQVVVVDIDEVSLRDDKLGQWPWPRTDVARLVAKLKEMGAKAIVFDMVFAEQDRTSPSVLLKKMPQDQVTPQIQSILDNMPDHDVVLEKALKDAGNVVTGFVWSDDLGTTRHMPYLSMPFQQSSDMGESFADGLQMGQSVTSNIEAIEKSSRGNGSFGQVPDEDGVIRNVPLILGVPDSVSGKIIVYPSLSLEALRVAEGPKIQNKIRKLRNDELTYFSYPYLLARGKYKIPIGEDGRFYIHYERYDKSKYIPAYEVLEGQTDPSRIAGKIVLIGTSAIGLKDMRSTPLSVNTPGVDIHRNVIEQIMEGSYLVRPSFMQSAEVIFTGIVGLVAVVLVPFVNTLLLGLVVICLVIGVVYSSFGAYIDKGILIDPVYPSLTILVVYFLASILAYIRAEVERRRVRQAFGLYISPDYMHELTKNPENLALGGETRDITVMFTDIRGFTSISEKMEPNELIQVMNDFLTPMSEQVLLHRGTIDKYMGDAMMTFWNAPLYDPDHERSACFAALAMRDALEPVNKELERRAKEQGREFLPLRAGVGVNSGSAAVGNMGSKQRFAYSVLGDTVNLASRLESQTKAYGLDILIGESTAEKVRDFECLEVDLLRVKGKTKAIRVFTILRSQKREGFSEVEERHNAMLQKYRAQDWDSADADIDQLLDMPLTAGLKGYYAAMKSRVQSYKQNPPANDWDGVHVAQDK